MNFLNSDLEHDFGVSHSTPIRPFSRATPSFVRDSPSVPDFQQMLRECEKKLLASDEKCLQLQIKVEKMESNQAAGYQIVSVDDDNVFIHVRKLNSKRSLTYGLVINPDKPFSETSTNAKSQKLSLLNRYVQKLVGSSSAKEIGECIRKMIFHSFFNLKKRR